MRKVEEWGHLNHFTTLTLVGIAELANLLAFALSLHTVRSEGLLKRMLEALEVTKRGLEIGLQIVDALALALVLVSVFIHVFFARNTSKEIATGLAPPRKKFRRPAPTTLPVPSSHSASIPVRASSPVAVYLFSGPSDPLSEALFALNETCFEGSSFEMATSEVRARDSSFLEKNPLCFCLVPNPLRDNGDTEDAYIGFTCVLPMNATGADVYLAGLVKDRSVRASMLCMPNEPSEHVVLFAMGLGEKYRQTKGLAPIFYPYLKRGFEQHVRLVCERHGIEGKTTLWAQAEHHELVNELVHSRGFKEAPGLNSADGFSFVSKVPSDLVRPEGSGPRP